MKLFNLTVVEVGDSGLEVFTSEFKSPPADGDGFNCLNFFQWVLKNVVGIYFKMSYLLFVRHKLASFYTYDYSENRKITANEDVDSLIPFSQACPSSTTLQPASLATSVSY